MSSGMEREISCRLYPARASPVLLVFCCCMFMFVVVSGANKVSASWRTAACDQELWQQFLIDNEFRLIDYNQFHIAHVKAKDVNSFYDEFTVIVLLHYISMTHRLFKSLQLQLYLYFTKPCLVPDARHVRYETLWKFIRLVLQHFHTS